jgi:hypothetical protein
MSRSSTIDTWLEWLLFAIAVFIATLVLARAVAHQSVWVAGLIYVLAGWAMYLVAHPWLSRFMSMDDANTNVNKIGAWWTWLKKGLNEILRFASLPLASVYIVFFLLVLYVALLLIGVPIGEEKPWIVRGVEWAAFLLFLVSLIELGADVLFRASIVDSLYDWLNETTGADDVKGVKDINNKTSTAIETEIEESEIEQKEQTDQIQKEIIVEQPDDCTTPTVTPTVTPTNIAESFLSRPRIASRSFRPRGYTSDKPYRASQASA